MSYLGAGTVSERCSGKKLAVVLGLGLPLMTIGPFSIAHSQERLDAEALVHSPAPCMDTMTFPLIETRTSSIDVAKGLRGLLVRFRAEEAPGWHETEMEALSDTRFQAVLPRPRPEAARVHYYFVWGRPEVRSPEYVVNVLMGGCPGARSAPPEMTEGIRIGRTSSRQDEIPREFSPDGIARGPSSRLTLGLLAGGSAGAAIAAVAIAGDEGSAPGPPPIDPETPRACFLPDPVPDIDSGDTLRFNASCTTPTSIASFEWNFGDGTTATGSSVEHVFEPGGTYNVTLTVSDGQRTDSISRVVRVLATPTACFATSPNPPRISAGQSIDFDANCSGGDRDGGPAPITLYEWDFGDGRAGREGVFVSRQFVSPDIYGVTLTVTNVDGRRDQTTQFVVVEASSAAGPAGVSFTSRLELPEGNSGQISLNATESVGAVATLPQEYHLRSSVRDNVIEASLVTRPGQPGSWWFDFSSTGGFVPGSLRVDSGQVQSLEGRRIVFRLEAGSAPAIRFRFSLRE